MTNKELVEGVFAALAAGDARPLVGAMRDDVRWTVKGTATWSQTFGGRGAVIEELFGALQAALEPPIRIVAERVIAEGDMVVVTAHGENTAKSGRAFRNEYCFVLRLEDGEIAELDEYTDTLLISQILG